MAKMLPGKFKLSERENARFVGYWTFTAHEQKDPAFAKLRKAYDDALSQAETNRAHIAKFRGDDRLSEKGVKDAAGKYVTETALPALTKNKLSATVKIRRDVAARLEKMKAVNIDKTDLVAEMQRRELREAIRGMPSDDRVKLVTRSEDPMVLDAILSVPKFLTGLPDSVIEMAEKRRLDAAHGPERELLGELIEAADLVDRAHDAARAELQHELGLTDHGFEAIAQPVEQPIVEEFAKQLDRAPATANPIQDPELLAEAIKALPHRERSQLIDLALERQVDDLYGGKDHAAKMAAE